MKMFVINAKVQISTPGTADANHDFHTMEPILHPGGMPEMTDSTEWVDVGV